MNSPRRRMARNERDWILLNDAATGKLSCSRNKNLTPTFTSATLGHTLTQADHDQILRMVLNGVLCYENYGPHGFGTGLVQLTDRARKQYARHETAAAGAP